MMMNRMHTHLPQAFDELLQGAALETGGKYDDVRCTKIKRFVRRTRTGFGIVLQIVIQNFQKSRAQVRHGSEFPHIYTREHFREARLITARKRPVRKVVREAFANEVMFL